jgi:hypothetical protein
MQDALKRYAADLQRAEGIPIAIRVGLNSGEVVVRSIGSDLHMDLAAQHRLPGLYPYRVVVDAGGLMAYDSYTPDLVARTATYVDKILRRMKPVDLPVEQPTNSSWSSTSRLPRPSASRSRRRDSRGRIR